PDGHHRSPRDRARHVRRQRAAPLPVHGPARQLRGERLPGRQLERRVRLERRVSNPNGTRGESSMAAIRQAGRWVCGSALLAAVIVAMLVLLPSLFGWQRYAIVSGSMTGTYDRG